MMPRLPLPDAIFANQSGTAGKRKGEKKRDVGKRAVSVPVAESRINKWDSLIAVAQAPAAQAAAVAKIAQVIGRACRRCDSRH
jgi:hypothetical protein